MVTHHSISLSITLEGHHHHQAQHCSIIANIGQRREHRQHQLLDPCKSFTNTIPAPPYHRRSKMKMIQIMRDHKVPKADGNGSIGKYRKASFPNDVTARKQLESRDEELIEERYDGDAASDERRGVDISHDLSQRLEEAVLLKKEDKMIAAAELLDGIDPNYFEPVHHIIVKEARVLRGVLRDCSSNPNHEGWTKRVEKHGKYHFSLETKLKRYNYSDGCTDTYDVLTFRVVTPIESSMLVPVLSVLNESELYCSWAPRFKVPKLGVSKSEKLLQLERCSQIALLEVDHPWPIGTREMIIKSIACDDVSTTTSKIVASLQTMDIENDGKNTMVRILLCTYCQKYSRSNSIDVT